MDPNIILLDGARGETSGISRETLALSQQVKDLGLTLIDRVESYEDIINLEVGDTSFTRARNLERDHGLRQLYLKFEGNNPTGTQKDRIAFQQCHDALRRGFEEALSAGYEAVITLDADGQVAGPTHTLLWERDGLLHELEADSLSKQELLQVARSVR